MADAQVNCPVVGPLTPTVTHVGYQVREEDRVFTEIFETLPRCKMTEPINKNIVKCTGAFTHLRGFLVYHK